MKNRIHLFVLMLVFSCFSVTTSQASSRGMSKEQAQVRVTEIKNRIDEIRSMDFSHLNKVERKDLKHELKDMKHELRADPTVVYISGGALILIIILLILLL